MWIRTGWPSCTGNFTPAVEEFPETWYFCPEYLQNNLAKTRDWITLMDMQIRTGKSSVLQSGYAEFEIKLHKEEDYEYSGDRFRRS